MAVCVCVCVCVCVSVSVCVCARSLQHTLWLATHFQCKTKFTVVWY